MVDTFRLFAGGVQMPKRPSFSNLTRRPADKRIPKFPTCRGRPALSDVAFARSLPYFLGEILGLKLFVYRSSTGITFLMP